MGKILGFWSGMRKYLEQEMLAESLKGKIRYGCTAYAGMDGCHIFEICIDGKQIKRFSSQKAGGVKTQKRRIPMISGIAVVGGNGSGKTTFGKYLAGLLGYKHMDVEDYYFRESDIPYADSRTKEEVQKMILRDIKQYGSFVLSSVGGDLGLEINDYYTAIVYVHAPLDICLARVKQRAIDKFGGRMLPGGDMYEQEQAFFQFVANRSLEKTDRWVEQMGVPVLHLDGTAPVADNVLLVKAQLGL